MRPGFLLGEVWNGLRRNLLMGLSVVLVTMVAVVLVGVGWLVQRQTDLIKGYWYDRIQVSVYLCNAQPTAANCDGKATTPAQQEAIKRQLEATPEVAQVYYESETEAFSRFKAQFDSSEYDDIRVGDIPASFRVKLKDPQRFRVVTTQFEGVPGVAQVQDQEKILGPLVTILDRTKMGSFVLAVAMTLCAVLIMLTTIRQAAFVRRREIGIMRLVGASNGAVSMPFVAEVLIVCLVGTGLGVGLLLGVPFLIERIIRLGSQARTVVGAPDVLLIAPWLAVGVAAVAVLTCLLALRRYLRV